MLKQIARYGIAGVVSTLFSAYSFPVIYEEIFGAQFFLLSYMISASMNLMLSFLLQRYYVFQSDRSIAIEVFNFLIGASLLMLMGYVMLYMLTLKFGINTYYSNPLIVVLMASISFVWHKFITFRSGYAG